MRNFLINLQFQAASMNHRANACSCLFCENWRTLLRCGKQGCQMVYFQTKNPNLGIFLEGLGMENVVKFYDQLEYFTSIWYKFMAVWYSLWPFGIFFTIWYVWTKKNLATFVQSQFETRKMD
jgi:hypothetical protein